MRRPWFLCLVSVFVLGSACGPASPPPDGGSATGGGSGGGGASQGGGGGSATGGGGGGSATGGGGGDDGGSGGGGGGSATGGGGGATGGGGGGADDAGSPTDGGSTGDAGLTVDAGPPWTPAFYTTWNASGSRLRARAVVDSNQNGVVTWFDDTQLNVRCMVRRATDGKRYCLPEAMDIEAHGGVVFKDSACMEQAVRVPAGCATKKYATWRNAGFYETAEVTTSTFYVNSGGSCVSVALPGADRLLGLTLADLSTFVAFPHESEVAQGADAGVGVHVVSEDGGASLAFGLWDRATGRPARAVEMPVGTTGATETVVIPDNPFPDLPSIYYRYDCAVTDLRDADLFVAPAVSPVPAFVQVAVLPQRVTPGSSMYRRVAYTQTTYCSQSGTTLTVPSGYLGYRLTGGAADLTQQPRLTRRQGVGPATNFAHYLTRDGDALVPVAALEQQPSATVGTTPVRLMRTALPVAVPTSAVQSSWEELFTDAQCTQPAGVMPTHGPGALLARSVGSALPAGACKETLTAAPPALVSLWTVNNVAATNGYPYEWRSQGGAPQCLPTNAGTGGPPPPAVDFRPTTEATGQAATLLPMLSTTQL